MNIWSFQLTVEFSQKSKEGFDGINYIFDKVINTENCDKIMLGLISYLSNLLEPPDVIILEKAEKQKIYPDHSDFLDIETTHLSTWIFQFCKEVLQRNKSLSEVEFEGKVKELAYQVANIFYGVPLVNHIGKKPGVEDLAKAYKVQLKNLFKDLL